GATEVGVAGGDSGGPQFNADGRIVSVTSYGLSFGVQWGDCRAGLQSSCGELNGFVPLYIHRDFILSNLLPIEGGVIPEPGTWAMLIAGFGFVGAAARRRRKEAVAA
ncbi:MAG: PEPxxWA-CTERM sorting domain-containing protein, partial [Sphingomonadaceae bacterium]